jgi:hypothetical protein
MRLPTALLGAFVCAASAVVDATGQTSSIAAIAAISPRTAVHVSADMLHFIVHEGSSEATASLDFTAAARAIPGADVLLIAEPDSVPESSARGPESDIALRFSGEGAGTISGIVRSGSRGVVARWSGGGLHQGRLVFTLQGVQPGAYTIPVRLFVSVP